jgi:hypothetical protein
MTKSDNTRCIREYEKKDGTFTYYAEVRRHPLKPLRKKCRTLTEAKNWVRKTESAVLEGQYVPDNKALKRTLSDLIERYIQVHLWAIFIISTFATPVTALKPPDFPTLFEPTTSLGFAA